ncbi:MAG: Spy/CpxP family protein refolding chaperone [bacterium]
MTKKNWIYLMIALVAIFGISATVAFAGPDSQSAKTKHGWRDKKSAKIGRFLGITDQQREEIRGTLENYRDDFKPLIEGVIQAKRELRNTVTADSFNENAIRQASKNVSDYTVELAVLAGKAYQDVSKILTPEQLDLIKEFKEMRQDHVDDLMKLLEKMPEN